MPWTAEEIKRVERLEAQALANKKHIEEIQGRLDRDVDGKQHAWSSMLDGAKKVLTTAFAGELDRLKPQFDRLDQIAAINAAQNGTLEEMRGELVAAREERMLRKAKEDHAEAERAKASATRRHRMKVAVILSPFLLAALSAIAGAAYSHITSQRPTPVDLPASPHH